MNKKEIINAIFYPRKSHKEQDSKDFIITVSDRNRVGCRMFLKDRSFHNILFFHGNAEIAQEYDDIAALYHRNNCNLIVSDYRGYGLSTGTSDRDNLLTDSIEVFDFTQNYLRDNGFLEQVVVMGRSLGSASAWEIAYNRKDRIKAIIIESGFTTEYPLLDLLGVSPDLIDFKLSDGFNSLKKIKKYEKPALIIHAEKDHIVPLSEGEIAYKKVLSKNKKIVVVESANHNNIIHCIGVKYFEDIKRFIDSL